MSDQLCDFSNEMIEAWERCHGPQCPPSIFAQPLWTQLTQLLHSAPETHAKFLRLGPDDQVRVLRNVRMSYTVSRFCGGAA